MEPTIVHRETLYKEVWAQPMSSLAKRYGISDVALGKVCRKLSVPVPPRGYWARIEHGYKGIRPNLPKLPKGQAETARIAPILLRSRALPDEVQKQRDFEADPSHRISVDSVRSLHPLVAATKEFLSRKSVAPGTRIPLDVRVSKESQDRALRLLSALTYALEERGFSVEGASANRESSVVVIKGERLMFGLEERSTRVTLPPDKKPYSFSPDFELVPTGKLTLRIHDYWAQGYRKSWSDGVKRSLEEQLNDIIPSLVDLTFAVREQRLESEKRRAVIEEQFRLRALQEKRAKQIEIDLRNWQTAEQLRGMIAAASGMATEEERLQPELTRWMAWANRLVAGTDPLAGGLEVFLGKYQF